MAGFTVFESPVQPTAVVRGTPLMSELPSFFSKAFSAVGAVLNARGTPPAHGPFAYYPTTPGATIEVEAGFAVDEPIAPSGDVVPSQLPGGTVVSGIHIGPYEKLAETYTAIADWAATQGLKLRGPMWEMYLSDPQQEPDVSTWRTEIFAFVVRAPAPVSAGIR